VFAQGATKVQVLDAELQIVIVLLEYKAEGDWTDNEGLFQRWN